MEVLRNVIETWASFFSNHAVVRTFIDFFHVGGLVLSGGCAIAADRITLRARHEPDSVQKDRLMSLRGTHRIVVAGLICVGASGLLLFGADTDTFLHSTVFWVKMALFALLLINGTLLLKAEKHVEESRSNGWQWLTATSIVSIVLWFLTTLAGAGLPNIG